MRNQRTYIQGSSILTMYEDGLGQWVVTLQDTATPDIFQVEMCATENQARDLFLEMAFHIMDANKR